MDEADRQTLKRNKKDEKGQQIISRSALSGWRCKKVHRVIFTAVKTIDEKKAGENKKQLNDQVA